VHGTATLTSTQTTLHSSNLTLRTYTQVTSNVAIRNSTGEGPALSIHQPGTGHAYAAASFYSAATGNAVPVLTIANSANTGIGTSQPVQTLHTQGPSYHSGNVGVGTNPAFPPVTPLVVEGAMVVSGSMGVGTTLTPLSLSVSGMAYVSSNVGIGVSNIQELLHIGAEGSYGRRKGTLFTGVPYDHRTTVSSIRYARFGVGGGISLHSAAVDGDGNAYTWGNNEFGQLGNGTLVSSNAPHIVSGYGSLVGRRVVSIACGAYHTIAVDDTGATHGWGYNNHGQLGNDTTDNQTLPIAINYLGGIRVTSISCGLYHTAAIDSSYNLYTWGNNVFGQLGRGGNTHVPLQVPRALFSQSNIVAVACGSIHTAAIDDKGAVYTWGFDGAGELGKNAPSSVSNVIPADVSSYGSLLGRTIVAIACGGYHTVALDSTGSVHTWGYNGYGQLGDGTTNNSNVAVPISSQGSLSGKSIVAIACGNTHTVALDHTNGLHAWGLNGTGQLGNGTTTNSLVPVAIHTYGAILNKAIVSMSCGYYHTAAMDNMGNIYTWGYNRYGQLGDTSTLVKSLPVYAIRMMEESTIRAVTPYMLVGTMVDYAASNYTLPSANGRINQVSITSLYGRTSTSYANSSNAVHTWYQQASAADNNWSSVCWAPELPLFCCVGTSGTPGPYVMTSPDGVTWTVQATDITNTNSWSSVCWSPELSIFCAVANAGASGYRAMTSPDGVSWTLRSTPADNSWQSLCWAAELGIFCSVSSDNMSTSVMVSTDGAVWVQVTIPSGTYTIPYAWASVCWSPDLSVFCCVSADGGVMTSHDGYTWNIVASYNFNQWSSVCWSPELSLFCAVAVSGTGDRVMTSTDGTSWSYGTSPVDNDWRSVCWSSQLQLFCSVSSSGTANRIMFSRDGLAWELVRPPSDNDWQSVCWAPELSRFCSVASTGTGTRAMTSRSVLPAPLCTPLALPSAALVANTQGQQGLGIGTTLPQAALHTVGTTSISGNVGIGTIASTTAVAARLYVVQGAIVSSGVGVGTLSPAALLSLPAGTTGAAGLRMTSGTQVGTVLGGSIEYNAPVFSMAIRNSTRGVTQNQQAAFTDADYLLTNSTDYQKLLDVGTNGSVTVPAGTSMFECYFALSNLNASSASVGFGLDGANISSQSWNARAVKSANPYGTGNECVFGHYTSSTGDLVSPDSNSYCIAHIQGVVKVSAASSITPRVSISAANTDAYVVKGTYFKIHTLHNTHDTGVAVGNWS